MDSNWPKLPREVAEEILSRVDDFDVVWSAQFVCSSWRSVARVPRRWRKIDMRVTDRCGQRSSELLAASLLRAVDYSYGNLESVTVHGFGTDHLLRCIAQRSNKIKVLKLHNCEGITDNGICEAVTNLPLLETIELARGPFSGACIESLGRNCPRLKSLTFYRQREGSDDDAIAIAGHLPGLRSLYIAGNGITDAGVESILEGCPLLSRLDLRRCPRVNFDGDLQRTCEARRGGLRVSFCSPPRVIAIYDATRSWRGQDKVYSCRNNCKTKCSESSHDGEVSELEMDDDDEFYESEGDDEDEIGESEGEDDDDEIGESESDDDEIRDSENDDNEFYDDDEFVESENDDEIRDSENDNNEFYDDDEFVESESDDEIRDSENDDDEFVESENDDEDI